MQSPHKITNDILPQILIFLITTKQFIQKNMDEEQTLFQLDQEVIRTVLTEPENAQKQVKELMEWHKNNKPSMAIVKHKFIAFLNKEGNKQKVFSKVKECLTKLIEMKANLGLIRAYLILLKENKEEINLDKQKIKPLWKKINMDHLEILFDAFGIKQQITKEQLHEYVQQLIKSERYDDCKNLIKIFGSNDKLMHDLLSSMGTNRTASKAADFIKEMNINQEQYPEINKRLSKKCLRHFLNKQGWQYAQELYEDNIDMLAYAVEDLIYNKKYNEAMYLYEKYLTQNKVAITKPQTNAKIDQLLKSGKYEKISNFLFQKTQFGPSDKKKYLSLENWGFKFQDVVWIDNQTQDIEKKMEPFLKAKMVGIDTESIVGLTKLQQPKEGVALIQLATLNYLVLIDCLNLPLQKISPIIKSILGDSKICKVGHTLHDDLKNVCQVLKIQKSAQNLIDVQKIYKGIVGEKHSNLSHIAFKILGKEVCKVQTLTNWKRRPLRKSQIHYGCMDAFVVVKIYEQMLTKYGEQYIRYFIDEEELKEQFQYD